MKPKRASKRGLTVCKLSLARMWAFTEKTHDCLSLIFPHKSARMIKREIQYIKDLIGTTCKGTTANWLHAYGLGFANEEEKQNFLQQDEELRKAA